MGCRWSRNQALYLMIAAACGLISLPLARPAGAAYGARPADARPGVGHRHAPPPSSSRPPELAFVQRAQAQLRRHEPARAVADLEQGLALYPRSLSLHYAAARILAQEGDYARARAHYQRMVALAPRVVGGYFGLAQAAFAQRDYTASAAALRGVLRLQPDSAIAYAKLGRIYTETFQTPKAIASLRKALALAPASEEAHFYMGDLMLGLSRLDEAQSHFEQAIALDSGNAHFHAKFGDVLLQRQENSVITAQALAAYQQAIRLEPRLAEAHYGLGRVYARMRRWREAAGELRTTLRLDSRLGRAHYTLAQVCRRLGQPAEAAAELNAFRRYRAPRPGPGDKKETRKETKG